MTETLPRLLLQLSEAGEPAILWGRQAARYAGREFERLLDRGVLVEQAPATEWDVCPACDCGLDVRPIQQVNGQHLAICPMDRRSDLVLDDDDLRIFRIVPAALVREISAASGLTDEPSSIAEGVWHLGETPSQRALFLALSRDPLLQSGMIGLMRSVARPLPVTVIVPAMAAADQAHIFEAGISVVEISGCLAANAVGFAIDLGTLASDQASEPHLVISCLDQRVMLGGSELHVPLQPFLLLVKLAEAARGRTGHLTPHQIAAEFKARIASDMIRDLRNALRDEEKKLIQTRRSPTGYFLALALDEFDLRQ